MSKGYQILKTESSFKKPLALQLCKQVFTVQWVSYTQDTVAVQWSLMYLNNINIFLSSLQIIAPCMISRVLLILQIQKYWNIPSNSGPQLPLYREKCYTFSCVKLGHLCYMDHWLGKIGKIYKGFCKKWFFKVSKFVFF